MPISHWIFKRIPMPDWVIEELERYSELYGKKLSEIAREALVEKALRLKREREDRERDVKGE